MIAVMAVDDHALLREGIAALINAEADMKLIADASDGQEAIEKFRVHRPDVTLMDLRLPDLSGIDALVIIRAEDPEARIIILTTFEGDGEVQSALDAGARSYLLKSMPPNELVDVIRQVHAGKTYFPPAFVGQLAEPDAKPSIATAVRRAITALFRLK